MLPGSVDVSSNCSRLAGMSSNWSDDPRKARPSLSRRGIGGPEAEVCWLFRDER